MHVFESSVPFPVEGVARFSENQKLFHQEDERGVQRDAIEQSRWEVDGTNYCQRLFPGRFITSYQK